MNRTPSSSNWAVGKPVGTRPASQTQFELQAQELGLTTAHDYVASAQLHQWVEQNRNRCYVPEWLLNAWRMTVDPQLSE